MQLDPAEPRALASLQAEFAKRRRSKNHPGADRPLAALGAMGAICGLSVFAWGVLVGIGLAVHAVL